MPRRIVANIYGRGQRCNDTQTMRPRAPEVALASHQHHLITYRPGPHLHLHISPATQIDSW